MNTSKTTISLTRTFKSPIELVWKFYTDPEYILRWWSPQGMETKINAYNFKENGTWDYLMKMHNGMEFSANGVFKEIQPMKKIVTTANFKPKTEGIELHVLFLPEGENTQFIFNVVHPTEAYKIEQEEMGVAQGWEAAFDRFTELLWDLC